jgi:hypothetical protein
MKALLFIKTIIVYMYLAITMTGLITNTLSFVVFSRKRFKNTIFSTYFRFYIIFQTLNLMYPIQKALRLNFNISFSNLQNFTCRLIYYFAYVSYSVPQWYLVLISIDRFLSISHSDKFLFKNKSKFQLLFSLFIIIMNICFYSPVLLFQFESFQNNQTNITEITNKCNNVSLLINIMDLFQSSLIPFVLMILSTCFTIKKVFESRKLINKNKSKDVKFATISIITNLIFLAFIMPYFIFIFFTYSANIDTDLFLIFDSFTFLCLYFQFIDVFFVNICVNSIFRDELKILFGIRNTKLAPSQIL